ncbi:MAG: formyltransferase family protein [Phycisphaerales bacterium]|jgi:phosphoribosylglycinamide formyltransferase-1
MTAPSRDRPLRVGALVSRGGRTAVNLAERIARGEVPAELTLAVLHDPQVPAFERLRAVGVPIEVVPSPPHRELSLEQADAIADRIDAAFAAAGVELVCLCGYLRRFRVGERWARRAINIHPALLPDFGGEGFHGLHVHRAVLAAGRTETGCTVHWVDEAYDRGETILQRRCPVLPGDTPESLAARVFAEECEAMPEAVARIATGKVPAAP